MIRQNLPDDLKEYFNDIDGFVPPLAEVLKTTNFFLFTLTLYRLTDMNVINKKDEPIYVYYFSTGKKRPTVNCTDILGGTMKWKEDKKKAVANYPIAFINAIACVLFKRWNAFTVCTNNKGMFDDGDTAEHFADSLKNVAYNNIQAVRFIETLSTTDPDNIYAIGVSLGALTMEGTYAIEDSYKKAVIIIGGYSLLDVIRTSEEGMVQGFYSRMVKLYGSETDKKLQDAINPIDRAYTYAPGEGILQIIMSNKDESVSTQYQNKYAETVKPKEVLRLPYIPELAMGELRNGHYQTLLYYPYLIYRSLKFLSPKKENKMLEYFRALLTNKLFVKKSEKIQELGPTAGTVVMKVAEQKAKKEFNYPLFFEWAKLIQRIVMVILTVALLLVLRTASYEIRNLTVKIDKVAEITQSAVKIAQETRCEINQQIDEFQKDGIKLHFRLW